MTEQQPQPERTAKFNSVRDNALYAMALLGWHNEETGRVSAPDGWVARISNNINEIAEVAQACEEDFSRIGFTDYTQIVGDFLIQEEEMGFVNVKEYDSEAEAQDAFNAVQARYVRWVAGLNEQ